MTDSNEILSIRNLYKVFGDKPEEAMQMLKDGLHKDEIFEKNHQTVGVMDASFSVKKGEIFVIMGLSGSGKSTLVRLLNRLIEPTSDTIELNGKDITSLADQDLLEVRRKEMSMVFQSFALMPHMTVLRNAAFGLEIAGTPVKERESRAMAALEQVGLGEHASSFPHQLSGGMQQRVGLARALTSNPTILLMDEAFSALDPLIRTEMQEELIKLQREQQRTIVFISHDLDEAIHIGDRIAIMEGGRIVQVGKPVDILLNPADDYVRSFFKGVDVSKVLKAGDIAAPDPSSIVRLNGRIQMPNNPANHEYGYLVDENGCLKGVLELTRMGSSPNPDALEDAQCAGYQSIESGRSLNELLGIVAKNPYPVPVVDAAGVFKGAISKSQLLQTLSR
ncbi:glycine betaine/L-proline ABC transporter ATP-binding protein ProV [Hahella ganghwensis]|uniref:glycine betaine/L-proline ABC transporter ATP-binding protein ProV n=1 Tax=Hahella ganghwensis TaxID=286420 RepID=UPI0003638FEA|nr:glycine betaine/L-proline ABC transporter ATP-binding protein ProV [Hahella ganghwensis]